MVDIVRVIVTDLSLNRSCLGLESGHLLSQVVMTLTIIMTMKTIIMIRTVMIRLANSVVKFSVHQMFGRDTKTTTSVEKEQRGKVKSVRLDQRMGRNLFAVEQNIRLPTPF